MYFRYQSKVLEFSRVLDIRRSTRTRAVKRSIRTALLTAADAGQVTSPMSIFIISGLESVTGASDMHSSCFSPLQGRCSFLLADILRSRGYTTSRNSEEVRNGLIIMRQFIEL